MGRLDNYVPVAERIAEATNDIKSITTTPPEMLTEAMGYIRATVELRDGAIATGTASFWLNKTGQSAQATNPIEDCETSAVGRALAFLGYQSSRSIATREDVQEAQERAASYQKPAQQAQRAPARPAQPTRPPAAQQPRQPAQQAPAATNTQPRDPAEAERRFFARYAEVIGGQSWREVASYLHTRAAKPTTVDGWVRVADAVRVQADYDRLGDDLRQLHQEAQDLGIAIIQIEEGATAEELANACDLQRDAIAAERQRIEGRQQRAAGTRLDDIKAEYDQIEAQAQQGGK